MWYRKSEVDKSNPIYEDIMIKFLLEQAIRRKYFYNQEYTPSDQQVFSQVDRILKKIKEDNNGSGYLRNKVTKDKSMNDLIQDIVDKEMKFRR